MRQVTFGSWAKLASALFVTASCCLGACPSPSSDRSPDAASSDAVSIAASSTTRDELGVVRWEVARSADGELKGFDADDRVRIGFGHAERMQDGRPLHAYVAKHDDDSARVILAIDGEMVTVLESSFVGKFERMMELLGQDLEAGPSSPPASSLAGATVSALSIQSLQPLDLVGQHCVNLVTNCDKALVEQTRADKEITWYCLPSDQLEATCKEKVTKTTYKAVAECKKAYEDGCKNAAEVSTRDRILAQKCSRSQEVADCKKAIAP